MKATDPIPQTRWTGIHWASVALIALAVACAFAGVRNLEFNYYDDPGYITKNPVVQKGLTSENIRWAFSTGAMANYHPLTWISYFVDVSLFGVRPTPMLIENVILHGIAAILLFVFLARTTSRLGASLFVALLFAVHPLRVESVAWVSERKDVLAAVFWMLCLIAYASYSQKPTVGRYLCVVAALVLGLLCKPMGVTLPAVLLLLDYWPLKRSRPWTWLVLEKLPLVLIVVIAGVLTIAMQAGGGATQMIEALPLGGRAGHAIVSYTTYLRATFYPVGLAVFYPHPGVPPIEKLLAALAIVGAISWLAWKYRTTFPQVWMGWLYFVGTLVPVLGLIQVGGQSHADRYTYLPSIGLAVAVVFSLDQLLKTNIPRRLAAATAIVAVVVCTALSIKQVAVWKNNATLFSHALEVTEDNYIAYAHVAEELASRNQTDLALEYFNRSLEIKPKFNQAYFNLGNLHLNLREYDKAIANYLDALKAFPNNAGAYNNMALAFIELGRPADADRAFRRAIEQSPTYTDAYINLGRLILRSDSPWLARDPLERALRLDPGNVDALKALERVKELSKSTTTSPSK